MLILSLESTGPSCGACVWQDGHVLSLSEELMERGQDQRLMPIVLDAMKKASVRFEDLDRIAVTRGPGSFTGLRLGLATARGLGLASSKPVLGINRFDVFFHPFFPNDRPVLVMINSKRKELFACLYSTDGNVSDPFMITPEELPTYLLDKGSVVITGDTILKEFTSFQAPLEKEVIAAAVIASQADPTSPEYLPRPLYIRAPDVTLKTEKRVSTNV